MKIKYTGPRPIINQHGVTFKDGKEDKYVYLLIGIQILQAIDKDFSEQKTYSYDITTQRVSDEVILKTLLKYAPNLEVDIKKEKRDYLAHLEHEIEQIKQRDTLSDVEKEVWINNLELMKNYRVQRAINKIYYMHNINEIAKIIKREKIEEIDTPFYEKYWHVLRTVQGELSKNRSSINSDLKIDKNPKGDMVAKLRISNL